MGIGDSAGAGISGKSLLGSIPGGAGDALGLSLCSWDTWSKHKASKERQRMENVSFPALCPDCAVPGAEPEQWGWPELWHSHARDGRIGPTPRDLQDRSIYRCEAGCL